MCLEDPVDLVGMATTSFKLTAARRPEYVAASSITMVAMTFYLASSISGNGRLRSGKVGGVRWHPRALSRSGRVTTSLHLIFCFSTHSWRSGPK
jgi:hypothetical protein